MYRPKNPRTFFGRGGEEFEDKMEVAIVLYIKMLMSLNKSRNSSTLAMVSKAASHDVFNKALHLERITNPRKLRGGYLLIDDTVVEKPYSSRTEGVFGYIQALNSV